ncbi:MAG: tetratricopeptide repeat protein, partial [Planctomycetota bacterium]|nr:tetratricopeptide repeat protein [Planctomycetota bacterium]
MRAVVLLLCLLTLAAPAAGEEKKPVPQTPATAMRAAFEAGDEKARAQILAGPFTDSWVVAAELRKAGAIDAALWMAAALADADRKPLVAYLERVRETPVDEKAWQALTQAKRLAKARKHEQALELLMQFKPDPSTVIGVEILSGRGEILVILRRLRECAERLAISGRAAEKLGWLRRAQRNLHKAGRAYWGVGAYAECVPLFDAAMRHARTRGQKAEEGVACYMQGLVFDVLGRSEAGLELLERAVQLGREAKSPDVEGMGLDGLGAVYERRGDSYTALEYRRKALAMAEQGKDAYALMVARSNISVTLIALGEGAEAKQHLEQAVAQARKTNDRHFEAAAQLNLGMACSLLGEMVDAFRHFDLAQRLAEQTGNTVARAKALSSKGSAYFHLHDYAPAKRNYEAALELAEGLKDPAMISEQLQNLGNIAEAQGDLDTSRDLFLRAMKLREQIGDLRQVLRLKQSLASGDAQAGRDAEAVPQFREILASQTSMGDRLGAVFTRVNLADSLAAIGEVDEGIQIARKARDEADALSERYALMHAYLTLARVCLTGTRLEEAIQAARDGIATLSSYASRQAEEQAASVRDRFLTLFEVGALAAWYRADMQVMLEFLEAGRAGSLVEVLGGRSQLVQAVVPEALAARERQARAREGRAWEALRLAKTRRRFKAQRAARKELAAAREELQQVMEAIQREANAAAGLVAPAAVTLEEIRGGLGEGEALVLYALFDGPACALVITRDGARPKALGLTKTLREAVRAAAWDVNTEDTTKSRAQLRSMLIESLELPTGIRRVLICPAGELAYVPFAALDPARTYTLVPSATTRRYLTVDDAGSAAKVLALGDPDYGTR